MHKLLAFRKSEKYQTKIKPEIIRVAAVIVFTMIYGFGVTWFLEGAFVPMYTGGIPGIAQLIRDIVIHQLDIDIPVASANLMMGAIIIVFNIPILIIGWFGVSKKFTIYSLLSVLIQATIIGLIPHVDLGLGGSEDRLTSAILGGLLVGVGVGGTLKFGTSTGGLDILAQYFSFKKGQTVGIFSMAMNVAIALLGGLIIGGINKNGIVISSWTIAAYTIMRIIVSTIITDRIHTSYQYLSVEIITDKPNEISDVILKKIYRGVTMFKGQGAYSHKEKTMLVVAILSYELDSIVEMVKKADVHAFIMAKPVKRVIGNFKRKTIA